MKPLATFNVGAAAIAVLVLSAPTKKSLGSAVNSAFSRMGVDREERNLKAQVLEKLSVDGLIPMWLYESADQIARNPEKMVIFNGGNKEDWERFSSHYHKDKSFIGGS